MHHLTPFPPASPAWRRTGRGPTAGNPREAEYECRRRANAGEALDPPRVHVRRRRMTIEGASAAENKNGDLLGFATTDEIGSVMDMTKTTKNSGYNPLEKRVWEGKLRARPSDCA